jgi:L-seryl-tRNA(Ser) seleniumtransferase
MISDRIRPRIRGAINATGIILHTGLGRAVWPEDVVESMSGELDGYVTLAFSRETGKRQERDSKVEYIVTELTGAEAGLVVNNNAAATMLVLAAAAGGGEVIVSRGQLIEIGGSFRLPDVMELISTVTMVEIGTTNRTHLRDYENAVNENTSAILRVHPSNYRVIGFCGQPDLSEIIEVAHRCGLPMIDDLGAGALVDLEDYGLPHEPTIQESISAGADVVLASTDKLIGGPQGGLIVGKKDLIDKCRSHPLYRALRADKACLMALERTLALFRDPEQLAGKHPLYKMLSETIEHISARADKLASAIKGECPGADIEVVQSACYLGSGSLPMENLEGSAVAITIVGMAVDEISRALRLDDSCVFSRIEKDRVMLDARTISDEQVGAIASAVKRVAEGA